MLLLQRCISHSDSTVTNENMQKLTIKFPQNPRLRGLSITSHIISVNSCRACFGDWSLKTCSATTGFGMNLNVSKMFFFNFSPNRKNKRRPLLRQSRPEFCKDRPGINWNATMWTSNIWFGGSSWLICSATAVFGKSSGTQLVTTDAPAKPKQVALNKPRGKWHFVSPETQRSSERRALVSLSCDNKASSIGTTLWVHTKWSNFFSTGWVLRCFRLWELRLN